jgi:hypothetical protein
MHKPALRLFESKLVDVNRLRMFMSVIASVETQTIELRQSGKTCDETLARLCTGHHRIARMIRIND